MTTIPRTSSDIVQISRADQRKQRLQELETEQAAEEAEALKMTEEQRQTLMRSFTSVKVEFTDLDGLRWSQAALRRVPPFRRKTPLFSPTSHSTSKTNTFVVLTNADLANFSPEDTIRVSASATKLRPRYPEQQATTSQLTTLFPESYRRPRDGGRSRSPIRGLFPSESTLEGSDSFLHPVDVPYFESCDNSHRGLIPVTDNGFVTKHKQGILSRGRRKFMTPPGLIESQGLSTTPGTKATDPFKEHIAHWRQPFPIMDTHDLPSVSTVLPPEDSLCYQPALPIPPTSPLIVHSFVPEPPRQAYSPQYARVRLHSILNGTIPARPLTAPVELNTTPSPLILSSATSGNGMVRGLGIAGDQSEDDDTPTTSPIMEDGGSWIR